jgi:UDP-glucuronate 4-epimerase
MLVAVTGVAGFIGARTAAMLLLRGHDVAGLDSFDDSYPVALKHDRIGRLSRIPGFTFQEGDIRRPEDVSAVFEPRPDVVVHLAAQGGLRRSMADPAEFISSNIAGFGAVIKAAAEARVRNFVYASSGVVYGGTPALPFREDDPAIWPMSLYGATKRCDELLAFTYARDQGLRCTGLRFFTVYGPDGRPDMAVYSFARDIWRGAPIRVHGRGAMVRDFVYIDDVAHCVVLAAEDEAAFDVTPAGGGPSASMSGAPWRALNVATGQEVPLLEMVALVESAVGRPAEIQFVDALTAEIAESRADTGALQKALGFVPSVTVADGIAPAVSWYLDYLRGHHAG